MIKKIVLLSCAAVSMGLGVNLMATQEGGDLEQERSQRAGQLGSDEEKPSSNGQSAQETDWVKHLNEWWIGPDGKRRKITQEELARKTQELAAKAVAILEDDGRFTKAGTLFLSRAELAMTPEEAAENYYQHVLEGVLPSMMELQESIQRNKCGENMPKTRQTCAIALGVLGELADRLSDANQARMKAIQAANAAHNAAE